MNTVKKYVITVILVVILVVGGVFNHHLNSNADTKIMLLSDTYRIDHKNATVTKTLEELEQAFRNTSLNYKKIDISYETEALNYDIYEQQFNNLNNQIADMNTVINEYSIKKDEFLKLGDTVNAQLCQDYISQYSTERTNLKANQAESKLNKDIYQFYKDNKTNLIREAQKSLEIDFKRKCLSLVTLKEQIEYYQASEQYIQVLLSIEKTKYNKGYSTITVVDNLEAQLANISTQIQQLDNINSQVLSDIKTEIFILDDFNINLEVKVNKKEHSYDTVSSLFASRNYEVIRLTKLVDYYQKHVLELKSLYGADSPYVKQLELKIRESSLDAQISNNTMNTLARESVDSYNYAYQAMKAKKLSVDVANQKYKELSKQYEKGKVAQIDLLKIEMEREQIEAEYYKLYCEFVIWNDIIEQIVPGQRP